MIHGVRQGQGFALDPPKAGGLWKPIHFQIDKVQGLGPWRVWAEPGLAYLHRSFILKVGITLQLRFTLVRALCRGLAGSSPERPCDDVCGVDLSSFQAGCYAPDLLD